MKSSRSSAEAAWEGFSRLSITNQRGHRPQVIRPEISVQARPSRGSRNELKFTRKITHRNICRCTIWARKICVFYITMEYVAGEDLKRFVKRAGPLNAGKAVVIAGQICDGLTEAHRIGAVHRDLKPQNIMIDHEGNAKIMDFGIARFTEMDRMTGSGVMIGTPEYMSPEQAEVKEVDARSDLYSLASCFSRWLQARFPSKGKPAQSAMKHSWRSPGTSGISLPGPGRAGCGHLRCWKGSSPVCLGPT